MQQPVTANLSTDYFLDTVVLWLSANTDFQLERALAEDNARGVGGSFASKVQVEAQRTPYEKTKGKGKTIPQHLSKNSAEELRFLNGTETLKLPFRAKL